MSAVAQTTEPRRSAADLFREVGPWEGETTEELMERLAEERRRGGAKEPPSLDWPAE